MKTCLKLKFLADSLMENKSSFIYGENPSSVPIYAVVSMCSSDKDFNFKNGNAFFLFYFLTSFLLIKH